MLELLCLLLYKGYSIHSIFKIRLSNKSKNGCEDVLSGRVLRKLYQIGIQRLINPQSVFFRIESVFSAYGKISSQVPVEEQAAEGAACTL